VHENPDLFDFSCFGGCGGRAGRATGFEDRAGHDPKIIDAQAYQKLLEQDAGKCAVNFWATWCEPCRHEYPMLNELAKQYAPQGLKS